MVGADNPVPANVADVIVGENGEVVDGPLAAIEVIEPDDVSAGKKLVFPLRIVHAPVVLVSAARIRHGKVKNTPIGNTVGDLRPLPEFRQDTICRFRSLESTNNSLSRCRQQWKCAALCQEC